MSSEPSRNRFPIGILMLSALLLIPLAPAIGQDAKRTGHASIQRQFTREDLTTDLVTTWTELQLAQRDSPYLVLNIPRSTLDVRLKGRLLCRFPVEFKMSHQRLISMAGALRSNSELPVEVLTSKSLYGYRKCYSDSVLEIIAKVIRTDPQNIQRYQPSRFELRFGTRLAIHVVTDIEPTHGPGWKTAFVFLRRLILRLLTKANIEIQMKPNDALTIYRMAEPDMPILIQTTE